MFDLQVFKLKSSIMYHSVINRLESVPSSTIGLVIQLAGAFSVLYGISYWSVPCAYVIGGLGAIWTIERQIDDTKRDAQLAAKTRTLVSELRARKAAGQSDTVSLDAVANLLSED